MRKRAIRFVSLMVSIMILCTVFAGCGAKQDGGKQAAPPETAQGASQAGPSGSVYPLQTNVKLKFWTPLTANVAPNFKNLGDTPYAKELTRRTGINVEYIHPTAGQEQTVLNLMLASGDLPDIIEWDFNGKFNGGAENAINQGYILKLNDVMDKYCPNLKQVMKQKPEFEKYLKTDTGSIYAFPMIRDYERPELMLSTMGPMVRKDWLDELGLEVPTTLDEWGTMLKAFKEKKGATAPLTLTSLKSYVFDPGYFISDYILTTNFYHDGDKVKWGILDPKYKDALELLSRWYKEGLLDKDVFSTDDKIRQSNIIGGKSGATIAYTGSGMAVFLNAMKDKDPKYDLIGTPNPTLKKGDTAKFGRTTPFVDPIQGSISAKSKNVEIAARLLDYGYSKEGDLFMNYGIEGESYKTVNGKPTFTDLIMNNPNKLPIAQAMASYTRACYNGALIQRAGYQEQYLNLPQQKDALAKWYKTDAQKYVLYGLTATPEEASQIAKLQSDINTYHDEMTTKFIIGVEPLGSFDKFQEQLKKLGADKMVEMMQAQYDRFKKR